MQFTIRIVPEGSTDVLVSRTESQSPGSIMTLSVMFQATLVSYFTDFGVGGAICGSFVFFVSDFSKLFFTDLIETRVVRHAQEQLSP